MKKSLIPQLRARIKKDPRLASRIAVAFGYRSTSAVTNWISRKRIPGHRYEAVEKILKEASR